MLPLKMKSGKLVRKSGRLACSCCGDDCATPSIECDSISASGSKEPPPTPCGYNVEGVYYSTYTWIHASTQDGGYEPCDYNGTYSATLTKTKALVEGVCTETSTWSGSSNYNLTGENCNQYKESCTATLAANGTWSGTVTPENGDPSFPITSPCGSPHGLPVEDYTGEVTPPEGETTGELIARVTGDLPSYSGSWSGGCSAARNLSPDESSFSISKFKWRITHEAVGTYLKVWLRKITTPEGDGPEYDDLAPYEWSGPGEGGTVTGPATEESVGSDGSVTVEILKWSCVEGYEPPDP